MIVYGGATGGGTLAEDDIYLLDLSNGEENAEWRIIPVEEGVSPGKRYGHTLTYMNPYIVLFGGYSIL